MSAESIFTFEYDAGEKVLLMHKPKPRAPGQKHHLNTAAEVDAFARDLTSFWNANVGEKVYLIVDYGSIFSIDPSCVDSYKTWINKVKETYALAILRCGGSIAMRSAVRLLAIKTHSPSNMYGSVEEARAMVKLIRAGKVTLSQ